MGRLTSFAVPGCRCWFYTGDHGPPHFHASAPGGWEIRVFFMFEPVFYEIRYQVRRIPGSVLSEILRNAAQHREALFREWEANQPNA